VSLLDDIVTEQLTFDGDLAGLLEDTRSYFARFVVADPCAYDMAALWIAHTYVVDCFPTTPYLNFTSPEPGCGKSLALEVLEVLVNSPELILSGTSFSALFRILDDQPTLLLDEVDVMFSMKSERSEDIRGILNAGYRKGQVLKRVANPQSKKLFTYHVYGAKAMSGIKELPGTLAHRSFSVHLRKALPEEVHEDFDPDYDAEIKTTAIALRGRWEAWAGSQDNGIRSAPRPDKLPELDARRNQISVPLLTIAELAGGDWPLRAQTAVITLGSNANASPLHEQGVLLLGSIRDAFDNDLLRRDPLTCEELVAILNDGDYGLWNDGRGISTRQLGQKLRPYQVMARTIRRDGVKLGNGYHRKQFEDAWKRYLPAPTDDWEDDTYTYPAETTGTTGTTAPALGLSTTPEPGHDDSVPVVEEGAIPHGSGDVQVVPVVEPGDVNECVICGNPFEPGDSAQLRCEDCRG
jgi:Protein of unknown function (DUF3631)